MGWSLWVGVLLLFMSGCASACEGVIQDPPDTSHTNSGSIALGSDGCLHSKPAYNPRAEDQARRYAAAEDAARELRAKQIAEAREIAARGGVDVPPPAVRYEIYAAIHKMTAQEIAALSPEDRDLYWCQRYAQMIDFELLYERTEPDRYYNLEALRTAGPPSCWAYLMSLH